MRTFLAYRNLALFLTDRSSSPIANCRFNEQIRWPGLAASHHDISNEFVHESDSRVWDTDQTGEKRQPSRSRANKTATKYDVVNFKSAGSYRVNLGLYIDSIQ